MIGMMGALSWVTSFMVWALATQGWMMYLATGLSSIGMITMMILGNIFRTGKTSSCLWNSNKTCTLHQCSSRRSDEHTNCHFALKVGRQGGNGSSDGNVFRWSEKEWWKFFWRLFREIFNKINLGESGQADRFGGAGGSPHPQPGRFYLWKFWPIFVLYKTAK